MNDKLKEAIEVLKDAKYIGSDEYASDYDREMNKAIDTVVAEYEKSIIDEETNRCKRCGCFGCICDSIDGI